jgi:hypothetical protein
MRETWAAHAQHAAARDERDTPELEAAARRRR